MAHIFAFHLAVLSKVTVYLYSGSSQTRLRWVLLPVSQHWSVLASSYSQAPAPHCETTDTGWCIIRCACLLSQLMPCTHSNLPHMAGSGWEGLGAWFCAWNCRHWATGLGLRSSGSAFQAIRPATENTWWPSVLRRCRGTTRWWRLEDRSRWRLATSDVGIPGTVVFWDQLSCCRLQGLLALTLTSEIPAWKNSCPSKDGHLPRH